MELIGTGLRAHRNDGLAVAIFGGEVIADLADFLQPFRVRHNRGLVEAASHNRETIQLNVIRKGTSAIHADRRELRATPNADAEGIQRGAGGGVVARMDSV